MARKTAVYTMRRDGWNDYFEMHVSPTDKLMRNHAEEIAKRDGWGIQLEGWNETQGLVHPMSSISGPFAYMFLSEDSLREDIVAHECLHIATSHERFVLRFGMDYGPQIGADEERLAYFMTSVIRGVYDILHEYKHIKPKTGRLYERTR